MIRDQLCQLCLGGAAREAGVPVNIRFLWEFEEEIGSPNFEKIISEATGKLRTGWFVVF